MLFWYLANNMKATKIKNLFFWTLTTAVSPSGGGSVTVNPLKNNYVNAESVILTAVPAIDYEFTGWSGDASGTTNPLTVTMTKSKSITANFQSTVPPTLYTLTVNVIPSGAGSVTVNPLKGTYAQNEVVSLTAYPASGNSFTGWSGGLSGSTNPTTITMTTNKTVNANFSIPVQEMEVPAGGIIMYTGSTAPTGFTKIENLKFVMTSSSTAVNKTSTSDNLSGHTHSVPASSTNGAHTHSTSGSTNSAPTTAYYYHGQGITFASAGHSHTVSTQNTSSSGGHSHAAFTSSAAGTIYPPYRVLNFIKNTSGGLKVAPLGSIVMIGSGVSVPSGWAVCNGSNGTVDLRGRFAYGTVTNQSLLGSGGSTTHTHAAKTTPTAGAHSHTYSPTINQGGGSVGIDGTDSDGTGMSKTPHTHTVTTFTTATQAAHSHSYPITDAASNMPPYVYLYYIQRIT